MKILLITNGCPEYRRNFFEELDKRYDIEFFFSNSHPIKNIFGNFKYKVLKVKKILNKIEYNPELLSLLNNDRFDIIIVGPIDTFAYHLTYIYCKIKRKRFITWTGEWQIPANMIRRILKPVTYSMLKHSDSVLTYGQHINKFLRQHNVKKDKMFTAQNSIAVNGNNFTENTKRTALRIKKQYLLKKNTILCVARLSEEKGLFDLLNAYKLLTSERNDTSLVIMGDGPLKRDLTTFCLKNNLKSVHIVSYNARLLGPLYYLSKFSVLSSVTTKYFKEPWGLVVNTSFSYGRTIIVSNSVGAVASGYVTNNRNGLVYKEGDFYSLYANMNELLDNEKKLESLSQNAKKTSVQFDDYKLMLSGFREAINNAQLIK